MDDATNDVEQVMTAVAGDVVAEDVVAEDVVAEDIVEASIDGSNAAIDATTDIKLTGHATAEDTASSLDREEPAAVTAAQVRPLRPGAQLGLRPGMPG